MEDSKKTTVSLHSISTIHCIYSEFSKEKEYGNYYENFIKHTILATTEMLLIVVVLFLITNFVCFFVLKIEWPEQNETSIVVVF